MKVLIQGNCALRTQMHYCQTMFPDWDVRGVLVPQANTWLAEGHAGFAAFLAEVDMVIGLTAVGQLPGVLRDAVRRVPVPPFNFYGYHPDALGIGALPTPLEQGSWHSRIVASSWLAGLGVADTVARFTAQTFDSLGYFDMFEADRARIETHYRDTTGIDIAPLFDEWCADGCFMYCPPHPRAATFFDVFHAVMLRAGLVSDVPEATRHHHRDTFEDYMVTGILWPLYPELAEHLRIPQPYPNWRLGTRMSTGEELDLPTYVARCHALYATFTPDQRAQLAAGLGSAEDQARAAAA